MFSEEKVAVYIDGSNFYHYLKNKAISFPKGIKFGFKAFVDFWWATEFVFPRDTTRVFLEMLMVVKKVSLL